MQALPTDTKSLVGNELKEPLRVWIEHDDGSIARGSIEVLSKDGALVRLTDASFGAPGEELAVRIAFSRKSPTLAARARVLWFRASGDVTECELAWTHSDAQREQLAKVVASLG
jgi:hypothetical protein